ncbi:MbtH family protein [Streptomyces gamaensis]|uniref:MbtH family protein n=1 Tax=Streptomyces gamaensis TaxID=1763542 RepID=A0ABW0Z5B2_9ACTN
MPNPFEDERSAYLVLTNAEHQYSLWPATLGVPAGWSVDFGPADRKSSLDHIETHWLDMRPKSAQNGE